MDPLSAALVSEFIHAVLLPIVFVGTLVGYECIQKAISSRNANNLVQKPKKTNYLYLYGKQKELAESIISNIKNDLPFSKGGVFLFGQPGNGKTLFVNHIAYETGAYWFPINPSDIIKTKVSDAEQVNPCENFKAIITKVKKLSTKRPVILFFDEVDFLCTRRDDSDRHSKLLTTEFLIQISEMIADAPRVYLFAASNYLERVDISAVRAGRIGNIVMFDNPNAEEISEMWVSLIKKYSCWSNCDSEIFNLAKIAEEGSLSRASVISILRGAGIKFFTKQDQIQVNHDFEKIEFPLENFKLQSLELVPQKKESPWSSKKKPQQKAFFMLAEKNQPRGTKGMKNQYALTSLSMQKDALSEDKLMKKLFSKLSDATNEQFLAELQIELQDAIITQQKITEIKKYQMKINI